jgi:hypothetical protein
VVTEAITSSPAVFGRVTWMLVGPCALAIFASAEELGMVVTTSTRKLGQAVSR